MKKFVRILVVILIVYLSLSILASAIVTFSNNRKLTGSIIHNRWGLMLMEYCAEDSIFVIWSPFNNACDVFLLVVDWKAPEELRIVSDGFYAFGYWW